MLTKAQIPEKRFNGTEGVYEAEIDQALLTHKSNETVTWNMPDRLWSDVETIRKLIYTYQDVGWEVNTYDGQDTYSLIFR